VVAYETDALVFRDLKRRLGQWANVTLVQADFLRCALPNEPYSACANLAFNITADVVSKLTTGVDPPQDAYLVIQREAVRRFMVDGRRRFTLVACPIYPRWRVRELMHIPAEVFFPQPAIVRFPNTLTFVETPSSADQETSLGRAVPLNVLGRTGSGLPARIHRKHHGLPGRDDNEVIVLARTAGASENSLEITVCFDCVALDATNCYGSMPRK